MPQSAGVLAAVAVAVKSMDASKEMQRRNRFPVFILYFEFDSGI